MPEPWSALVIICLHFHQILSILKIRFFEAENHVRDFVLKERSVKPDIHPEYDFVVFKDSSSDFSFLTRSTKKSEESIKWKDGKKYPLVLLEITSASHPFFTGKQQLIDSAGRVEKFMRKYGLQEKDEAKKVEEKKADKNKSEPAVAEESKEAHTAASS